MHMVPMGSARTPDRQAFHTVPRRPNGAVLTLIALSLAVAGTVAADESTDSSAPPQVTDSSSEWTRDVVQRWRDSVVLVTVEGRDGRQAGLGSGFVVSEDGLVATNLHVIGEARPITVRFANGKTAPVTEVHASDQQFDLAVVRIDVKDLALRPFTLVTNTEPAPQGEAIVALGNPMGLKHSVVSGVVSGHREIAGRRMIQLAMPIEPGNSGGPVLDREGQVLGIVTLKSAVTANLGFAIEASALDQLLEHPNPIGMSRWQTIGSLDPAQWTPLFGARWRREAGHIVVRESGDSFGGRTLCLWSKKPDAANYEVAAFVKLADETGAAGVVFGADGKDRHYGFYPSGGRLRLTRFDGPTVYSWQVLEELPVPEYRPGEWNHLKVAVHGKQVTCYVNDQVACQRDFSDLQEGHVGLAKFRDTEAEFRDFQLAAKIAPSRPSAEQLGPVLEQIRAWTFDDLPADSIVETLSSDAKVSRYALQREAEALEARAERLRQISRDLHTRETCDHLMACLASEADDLNLVEAALWVSRLDNPYLDVQAYVDSVAQMAREIGEGLDDDASPGAIRKQLDRYLFEENGFHGSRINYYQAANSHIDRVIDDREGLPLTLAILYMELGRQLKLNIEGVPLPGHFVVRHRMSEDEIAVLDVFDRATLLSDAEVEQRVRNATGGDFDATFLEAATPKSLVERMLRNLQGVAERQQDPQANLRYLEALVMLEPENASYRGMRAVVRHQTGRRQEALQDLDWFLEAQPPGIDLNQIRVLRERFEASP